MEVNKDYSIQPYGDCIGMWSPPAERESAENAINTRNDEIVLLFLEVG